MYASSINGQSLFLLFKQDPAANVTFAPSAITAITNAGTAIILQANNDLTVNSTIISDNPSGNGGTITLQTGRSILINANLTTDNGNLFLYANDTTASGVDAANRDAGAAVITLADGTTLNVGSGTITIELRNGASRTGTAVESGDLTLASLVASQISAINAGPNNGNVILRSGATITASGTGTAIALSPAGNFINNVGASVFSTLSGRWLIYSATPTADTRGGLVYSFKQYNATLASSVLGTGHGFLYAVAPTLTASLTGTTTKIYDGTDAAALNAGNYQLAGQLDGDTVTLNNPASGTSVSANVGTGLNVGVSGIAIVASTNGAVTVYGYQLASTTANANIGEITAASLTYSATAADRTYGASNPTFTGTVTGFVNSETLAGATTGTLAFNSAATVTSNVGNYAVMGLGLTANNGNCVFVQTAGNATALTINLASLTITANYQSKTYGDTFNFAGTEFTFSGLQNSETIGSVTLTSAGAAAAANAAGSPYVIVASGAVGCTFDNANYSINYADGELTITANSFGCRVGQVNPTFTATVSGFVLGQDESALGGGLAFSGTGPATTPRIPVVVYSIIAGGYTSTNYVISYFDGTLTVSAAPVPPQVPVTPVVLGGIIQSSSSLVVSGANPNQLFDNLLFDQLAQPPQSEIEGWQPKRIELNSRPKFLTDSSGEDPIQFVGDQLNGMPKFLNPLAEGAIENEVE